MKYIYLFFILSFALISCSISDESDYCVMAYKTMDQFVKDMSKKHNLALRRYGGSFLDQINWLTLSFETIGPLSQEELRELMVEISEDFLERINKDERIRPYLLNYPFNASNLEFMISLKDTNGNKIQNQGKEKKVLYLLSLLEGRMIYKVLNDDNAYVQKVYEETYSEALEIVKKQRPDLFQQKDKSLQVN